MKKVFDTFDQLKIEAESEEETEKEVPERPPPPTIPKRNFEVEPKENDSGVSSGGENPTDVLQDIFPRFLYKIFSMKYFGILVIFLMVKTLYSQFKRTRDPSISVSLATKTVL